MNILIVNGPNLNMLGIREKEVYGNQSYRNLVDFIENYANLNNIYLKIYQSNSEGEIIDIIQNNYQKFDGLIINPAAYTHYSYAIFDCLKAISIIKVEVHLSNIYNREDFRKISVTKAACDKQIYGKGFDGYIEAIDYIVERSRKV